MPISISQSIISKIDTSELQTFIGDIDFIIQQIPAYFQASKPQIIEGLRSIMRESYFEAVSVSGNFPVPYEEHLLQGIALLTPSVDVVGDEIYVGLPDIEGLGSIEELYAAVHTDAIAETGGYPDDFEVHEPPRLSTGEPNTYERRGENAGLDDYKREEYFEAMMRGETDFPVEFGTGTGRRIKMMRIPDPGGYATFRKRTQFWGGRYPEWIVLEVGDPEIGVSPGGFTALYEINAELFVAQYVEGLAVKIIDVLARGRTISFRPDTAGEILHTRTGLQLASRSIRTGRFTQFID